MAEAHMSVGGTSDEEAQAMVSDGSEGGGESYRSLCEHYSRGCSFVVSSVKVTSLNYPTLAKYLLI